MASTKLVNAIQSAQSWADLDDCAYEARNSSAMPAWRAKQEELFLLGCAGPRRGTAFDFDRVLLAVKSAVVAAIAANQVGIDDVSIQFLVRAARTLPIRQLAGIPADEDDTSVGFWVKQQLRSDKSSGKLKDELMEASGMELPSNVPAAFVEWYEGLYRALEQFCAAPENMDVQEMRAVMRYLGPIIRMVFEA